MPNCFFVLNGNLVKVNHKNRLLTAFKKDSYKGIEKYSERIVKAYEIARVKNRLPLLHV